MNELPKRFLALHRPGTPLLVPNPWDAGSAKLLASLGFEALATTSAGFAATLGRVDNSLTREEALAHSAAIVAATPLPVSADLENGFADDADGVADTCGAPSTPAWPAARSRTRPGAPTSRSMHSSMPPSASPRRPRQRPDAGAHWSRGELHRRLGRPCPHDRSAPGLPGSRGGRALRTPAHPDRGRPLRGRVRRQAGERLAGAGCLRRRARPGRRGPHLRRRLVRVLGARCARGGRDRAARARDLRVHHVARAARRRRPRRSRTRRRRPFGPPTRCERLGESEWRSRGYVPSARSARWVGRGARNGAGSRGR